MALAQRSFRKPSVSIRSSNRKRAPLGHWNDLGNQKHQFQIVEQKLNITHLDGWYTITQKNLRDFPGMISILDKKYSGSLFKALQAIYPQHNWCGWKFSKAPQGFWDDFSNHVKYFDWLGNELNIKSLDGWYDVKTKDLGIRGGLGLLDSHYGGSLLTALPKIYPEHNWQLFRFRQVPHGYWNSEQNVISYLNWLSQQYGITHFEDWYNISSDQISKTLLLRHGGIVPLLSRYYPQYQWRNYKSTSKLPSSKAQLTLFTYLRAMFTKHDIFTNYRNPQFLFKGTNREMEFDIFIPQLNLVFEYQGPQHYMWNRLYGSPEQLMQRDKEKLDACSKANLTLFVIPYWWDKRIESLTATIISRRPDLIPFLELHAIRSNYDVHSIISGKVAPISTSIPQKKRIRKSTFGSLVDLVPLLPWKWGTPTDGWMVSPNLNGIRLVWNGLQLTLPNNTRLYLDIPQLPSIPLDLMLVFRDGTLSAHANRFEILKLLTSSENKTCPWEFKLIILDAPTQFHLTFQQRIEYIHTLLKDQSSTTPQVELEVAKWESLGSETNLLKYLRSGDLTGLFLKKSRGYYLEPGSFSGIKLFDEQEAVISEIDSSSVLCRTMDGTTIRVVPKKGLPYKEGTVVTLAIPNNEIPGISQREPAITYVQPLEWQEVLESTKREHPFPFRLTTGRGYPSCRACGEMIRDKNLPRLEVRGAYSPPSQPAPHPARYTFCAKQECIEKVKQFSNKSPNTTVASFVPVRASTTVGVFMPPFQNIIAISPELKEALEEKNPTYFDILKKELPQVQWVVQ